MIFKYKYQRIYLKVSNHITKRLRIGMITLFNYDNVGDFHDGLSKVCYQNKWGFINKYGFEVVSCMYEEAGDFYQGRARVRSKGKWGFLDKKGKVRVSYMFDEVRDFKYGAAKVTQSNKCYYIDKNGHQISSINSGKIGRFHLTFRLYELIKNKKRKSRRYLGGETKYQVSTILKDGLRRATVDANHYGYVNNKGKLIINIQYEKAFDFHEKRARVELNGKIGFINKKNKRVIPIEYNSGSIQAKDGIIRLTKNGKSGFLSKNNKQIIGFYYDRTKNFNQGLAGVCNDNEWGYIDLNDNKIIPLTFEDCRSFNEGIAGVKLNGKWGFICIPSKQSIFSIILKILLSPKTNNKVIDEFGNNLYDRIELIKPAPKQTKRQKEFIEAVDSLKSLTSEIEEYLENNKQDESVYDWQRKIRININEDACIQFLQKYGKGELTESMRRFANGEGETIKDKYRNWLKWSKANKKAFGAKDNSIDNVVSNAEILIPEYNWEGIEGGWYEIFIYLYDIEHSNYLN